MAKKLGLIALILLLTGLAALVWTFSSARLEFTPLDAAELPPAMPPSGMTLSSLPTGSMESRALFAYRGGSLSDKRDFAMTAFLVRHPKGDLLFDTGFGFDVDQHIKTTPWLMQQMTTYTRTKTVANLFGAADIRPHSSPASSLHMRIGTTSAASTAYRASRFGSHRPRSVSSTRVTPRPR